jgi:hypothetical protein
LKQTPPKAQWNLANPVIPLSILPVMMLTALLVATWGAIVWETKGAIKNLAFAPKLWSPLSHNSAVLVTKTKIIEFDFRQSLLHLWKRVPERLVKISPTYTGQQMK